MRKKSIADIINEYEVGYISKQDLYVRLVLAADQADDRELFASQIPAEHLEGLLECVSGYTHAESTVYVGPIRVDAPRQQTIADLHATLSKRIIALQGG